MNAGFHNDGVADSNTLEKKSKWIVFQFDPLSGKKLDAAFSYNNIVHPEACDKITIDDTKLKFTVDGGQGFLEEKIAKVCLKGPGLRVPNDGNKNKYKNTANVICDSEKLAHVVHSTGTLRRIRKAV
jgi:hypothetical protein